LQQRRKLWVLLRHLHRHRGPGVQLVQEVWGEPLQQVLLTVCLWGVGYCQHSSSRGVLWAVRNLQHLEVENQQHPRILLLLQRLRQH
jgi:hypothetical protein